MATSLPEGQLANPLMCGDPSEWEFKIKIDPDAVVFGAALAGLSAIAKIALSWAQEIARISPDCACYPRPAS
jgi:hypothetical protein